MKISFEKWHGCRNDFIVLEYSAADYDMILSSLQRQAAVLCVRDGSGIGADGILVLKNISSAGAELTIINSDGSLAKNCGNGVRCAAGFIYRKLSETSDEQPPGIELIVENRSMLCQLQETKPHYVFATSLGELKLNEQLDGFQGFKDVLDNLLGSIDFTVDDYCFAEIGNLHCVLFVEDMHKEKFRTFAQKLQQQKKWDGINVHFCRETSENAFEVYVWERGVGETMACGSGAVSVAGAAFELGLSTRENPVKVLMPGGELEVVQRDADDDPQLSGLSQWVFNGELEL